MEGNDHGEAYTAISWGGLLSREGSNVVEAEAFSVAEGNMCGAIRRGADALPRSKTPSRENGSRRNLGDPTPPAVAKAIPGLDRKSKPPGIPSDPLINDHHTGHP